MRPTSDRVREALFNVIEHSDFALQGARVLDLFAGSGALGLEALSRGATFALFVDDDAQSRALVRQNVEALELTGITKIYRRDAARLGDLPKALGGSFDFLFLDPPYGKGLVEAGLHSAVDGGWMRDQPLIVCECGASEQIDLSAFQQVDERFYGDTKVLLATTK